MALPGEGRGQVARVDPLAMTARRAGGSSEAALEQLTHELGAALLEAGQLLGG